MKKCGILFIILLVAVLFSCNMNSSKESNSNNAVNSEVAEIPVDRQQPAGVPVNISGSIPLDSNIQDSPVLDYSMELEPIVLNNAVATAKAVNALSYAITGTEHSDLGTACDAQVKRLAAEFQELRPDYIDIRENYDDAFWPDNHYNVKGVCEKGYKGYENYILNYDEYEGGAHGYYYTAVHTFDPRDGHEVTLDEIMKEGYEEALLHAIAAGIQRYCKANDITELDWLQRGTGELFISKNAVLRDSCITFIYNPYEIASYAVGKIEADITYKELKHILK
ncbi:MAG: DUF3298 domain-containing protein [Bacteroidaceae bacterium]|nr:DUF3298 domain-containing protein [Bacteroidaceae bacterium]